MTNATYIFLDESGNLDFSDNGTRHFVIAGVCARRPFPVFDLLDGYKHSNLESGGDIEYFHCYNDRRALRDAVFNIITSDMDDMRVNCLVVEKSRIATPMRDDLRFYPTALGQLLSRVIPSELAGGETEQIIVITDTIPINRRRRAVERAIRTTLSQMLPAGVKYRVLHHQSRSHYGLQVADYCCWAVFRKWEMGDSSWFDRINPTVWLDSQTSMGE